MRSSNFHDWMWSEALDLLSQADRLHRRAFGPQRTDTRAPSWEPPVDVLETEDEVIVLAAMPGVDPATMSITIEGADLVVSGERVLPAQLRLAKVHRLELPQGSLRRRIPIPDGRYDTIDRTLSNGCLVVVLRKVGGTR
jgi:HSP20 family protein